MSVKKTKYNNIGEIVGAYVVDESTEKNVTTYTYEVRLVRNKKYACKIMGTNYIKIKCFLEKLNFSF